MNIIAGLDIGNGYTKGKIKIDNHKPFIIDAPSLVAYTTSNPVGIEPTTHYMDNLCNELDAEIVSSSINQRDRGRLFFGTRGIKSGSGQTEFNINSHTPKCLESLSLQLILGTITACAIRDYWYTNQKLPETELNATTTIALALPIGDYTEHESKYRQQLIGTQQNPITHYIHVHNFEKTITVAIQFERVVVLPEGTAGQYAITALGSSFLQLTLNQARATASQYGVVIDNEYTGELLVSLDATLGVDIGEGTVNFPVFRDGKPSVENSFSITKGYGSVLGAVVTDLSNDTMAFESRKHLADFMMMDAQTPTKKRRKAMAQKQIDKHLSIFARDIISAFSNTFRKVGDYVDVIYVYGGGASPMEHILYEKLITAATKDAESSIPIIYMDSRYARDLNRNGLFLTAEAEYKEMTNRKTNRNEKKVNENTPTN